MTIEIRHLRLFLAVADELHFTRAAERMHLAQPALSAQIKKLEENLGLTLLERNTRAVALTDAGRILRAEARAAVEAYDRALATAAMLRRGGAGHLALGINPRSRSQMRMRIMERLSEINPRVTVDFIAEGSVRLVEEVAAGRLDAALCVGPRTNPNLRSLLVRDDPLIVAIPAAHPLAGRESISLAELRDERWILPSSRVYGSNATLQQECRDVGFEMLVSETASDYDEDFTGVARGGGIEVVPYSFTRRPTTGVAFVPLRELSIPLQLIWQPASEGPALSCLVRAVLDAEASAPVDAEDLEQLISA